MIQLNSAIISSQNRKREDFFDGQKIEPGKNKRVIYGYLNMLMNKLNFSSGAIRWRRFRAGEDGRASVSVPAR